MEKVLLSDVHLKNKKRDRYRSFSIQRVVEPTVSCWIQLLGVGNFGEPEVNEKLNLFGVLSPSGFVEIFFGGMAVIAIVV
jgi:hypothetical protein